MSYPPSLALDDMQETYPCWSPDGRTLYFCRTPVAWPEPWTRTPVPENFRTIQYDLMKVSFDIETGKWGEVETLLTAKSLGLSLLEPRVSPDGRFLMFVATQYGDVAIYHKDGDLYLLELATGKFRRMECNSDNTEGWHSWSSNGRWIAFTSRRDNSLYARTYFAYVDGRGVSRKAFVLPQEDGAYYDSLLLTYNLPELITGPVPASEKDLVRTVRTRAIGPSSMPVTGATPKRGQGSAGDQ